MDRVQNSLEKDNSLVQFVMVKRGQSNDTSHIQKELLGARRRERQ